MSIIVIVYYNASCKSQTILKPEYMLIIYNINKRDNNYNFQLYIISIENIRFE